MSITNPYFIKVDEELIPYIGDMLTELWECQLNVCLIPSTDEQTKEDGGMIRVAISKNPEWYSELCSSHIRKSKKKKKFRTIIKRRNILEILEHMINSGFTKSKYGQYLLSIAENKKQTLDNFIEQEFEPWNNQF